MLTLRTFGALQVLDAAGRPMRGAAGQRRLLALLAALATAGESGLSRDKLIGLLWPESDSDRARHSLTQTLYAARRALGVEDLFAVGSEVRLNGERLDSDVATFERAFAAGDLIAAVTLYRGPFLDGYFYPGSAEFEQWCTRTRARLEDRAAGALERLAGMAEVTGGPRAGLEWRKRLAELRPLDGAAALALMEALASTGDRAGALRHARVHAALVRGELDLAVDPKISAFVARLHQERGAASVLVHETSPSPTPSIEGAHVRLRFDQGLGAETAETPALLDASGESAGSAAAMRPTGSSATLEGDDAGFAPAPSVPQPVVAVLPASTVLIPGSSASVDGGTYGEPRVVTGSTWGRRRGSKRLLGAAALAAIAVLTLALGVPRWREQQAADPAPAWPAVAPLPQAVVVAPFRVTGASTSLAYLRDGLVELLSARLADDSASRSVDAGAVLSAWRKAGLAETAEVPRLTLVRLAGQLGAERVVVGSVVGNRGHAVIRASVVVVPSGAVTGEATVEGPADSVTTLVDRLAARLLVVSAGEDESLASQTTASLAALRLFLTGQAAFRSGNFSVALRLYERAVQRDSTFALAAVQLARTADRLGALELRGRALATAWSTRAVLGERDRAQLAALVGPKYPGLSRTSELRAAWERLVALTPQRANAWYEVGSRLVHDGPVAGVPAARTRAVIALRRTLALDSAQGAARQLLTHLAVGEPVELTAGGAPHDTTLRRMGGALAPFLRWRVAAARGDTVALTWFQDTMPRLGPANLRAVVLASQFDGVRVGDAALAVRALRVRATRLIDRVEATLAEHALALNTGRLGDARAAAARLDDLQPGAHGAARLHVLDAIYGDVSPVDVAGPVELLRESVDGRTPSDALLPGERLADACVVAQWSLARGDTVVAARAIALLRASVDESAPRTLSDGGAAALVATPPAVCLELVTAAWAVLSHRADAAGALLRLDSLAITSAVASDAATYAPIFLGRLHARAGDLPRALAAVQRREYMVGWPRYLTTALREAGAYAVRAGDSEAARSAYSHFLRLRSAPDGALTSQRTAVRQALAALPRPAGQ